MPGLNPEWRTRNIGRLLHCAAEIFVTDKLAHFNDNGFGSVSQVHVSLIQNLDLRRTRLSTIASRARVTKQTMLELVDVLKRSGSSRADRTVRTTEPRPSSSRLGA